MILITNACLYSQSEPDEWLQVDRVDLGNGLTAYKFNGNISQILYPDGKYASARANGIITAVDSVGPNETFIEENGLAKTKIGEGFRVIKVA